MVFKACSESATFLESMKQRTIITIDTTEGRYRFCAISNVAMGGVTSLSKCGIAARRKRYDVLFKSIAVSFESGKITIPA